MVGGLFGLGPVVAQQGASASRSMSATVVAGGELTVTITASGYGFTGQVVETLPDGFSYESSNLSNAAVTPTGQVVRFTLFGDESFMYTVTAPSAAGSHTFSGKLTDEDLVKYDVTGDSMVTVEVAPVTTEPRASRSMPGSVAADSDLVVTITAADYGSSGQAVETLPTGFIYKESSLADTAVTASGQTVSFTLGGEGSFTYTVTAPSAAGSHTFSGKLTDEDGQKHDITGVSMVTVATAPVTTGPRANRSLPGSVAASGDLTVTINAADYGVAGQVVETLPTGFSYKESSLSDIAVTPSGQTVMFTLVGDASFTYTVTAPNAAGSHTFSGKLTDEDLVKYDITGDSMVTVGPPVGPRANRSMPGSVAAGGDLVVTINAAEYGVAGAGGGDTAHRVQLQGEQPVRYSGHAQRADRHVHTGGGCFLHVHSDRTQCSGLPYFLRQADGRGLSQVRYYRRFEGRGDDGDSDAPAGHATQQTQRPGPCYR